MLQNQGGRTVNLALGGFISYLYSVLLQGEVARYS